MRKLFLSVLCVTALFASCAEADIEVRPVMGGEDFTATIAETRAELDGVAVLWNDADELTIFTKTAHNRHYKVKSLSNGNRSATFGYVGFSGNDGSKIENNYAVYPYDADATLAGEIITTKINAEQVYNAEKVDLSNALMAAKSTSSALQFVNSTALMRFDVANNMPDSYTLSSIKLVSAANKIAGEATINLSTDSKAVVTENGVNEVTLSGIDTPITAEKQAFYVALPATSFAAKDLTVTFTYAEGVEKSFALPAFNLELGSIKTIAYTINEGEDFEGSTPDSGEDFEGETPGTSDANMIITYKAPDRVFAAWNESTFGASIVSHEFDSDTMLGTITCDDVVTTIGANAFNGVTLFGITIPSTVTSIGDLAFIDTHLLSVVIPDSVISIGNYAFQNTSLKSITIPDSVTEIGNNPFAGCTNLKKFEGKFSADNGRCLIVDGVLKSFALDCGVTEYTIPDSVISIGDSAFNSCYSLTSITIPDSVTTIGNYAFYYCPNLTSVYCKAITPPAGGYDMFTSNASGRKIYVPMESVEAYKSAWSDYASFIEGYEETTLGAYCPNRYITYVDNYYSRASGDNIYRYRSYITSLQKSVYEFQIKVKMNAADTDTKDYFIMSSSNEAKATFDGIALSTSGLGFWINNHTSPTVSYTYEELGVTGRNDLIDLYVSFIDKKISVNGKELEYRFSDTVTLMESYYLFGHYYYDSYDGVWKEYYGFPEGSQLFFAKCWDSSKNLIYLGQAAEAVNSYTGNIENCWKYTTPTSNGYKFASYTEYGGSNYVPFGGMTN